MPDLQAPSTDQPRIVTVVQARTTSTRLPNKIMLPVVDKPLITRMMERLLRSRLAGTVVMAITTDTEDDPLETLCLNEGFECFRGHPLDLLDRHYQAALKYQADIVLKIPSDCPLIDPSIIDQVIEVFLEGEYDYVSNLHPGTWPDGNDVEVMPFAALEKAWQEASKNFEREHTTPFLWERPDRFKIQNVSWETGLDYSMSHRWTIDYEEDYHFIKTIFEKLLPENPAFTTRDVLDLLDAEPEIMQLNAHLAGVNWYRHHMDELKTISSDQTKSTTP